MRIGSKKRPFYRVVAVDERRKRTGGYLELLGTYNPLTEPKEIKLNQPKIDEWIKKGAVMSTGFLRIIGKAPQRFRKPKKEAPTEAVKESEAESSVILPSGGPQSSDSEQNNTESKPVEATIENTNPTDTPTSTDITETTETPAEEPNSEEKPA